MKNIHPLFESFLTGLSQRLGVESCAIFRFDSERNVLRLEAACGAAPDTAAELPVTTGPLGAAVRSGRIVTVPPPAGTAAHILIAIPLLVGDSVVGVLALACRATDRAFRRVARRLGGKPPRALQELHSAA